LRSFRECAMVGLNHVNYHSRSSILPHTEQEVGTAIAPAAKAATMIENFILT
jgi:hypothetical protein